jgi:hypothetical protein
MRGGETLVTWGRAWRASGARLGWSIVWGIAGWAVFGVGLFVLFYTVFSNAYSFSPYYGYNFGNVLAGLIGGIVLMVAGQIITTLGSWATFFKISSEVVSEEVCKQLRSSGVSPPQNMGQPAGNVAAAMCPTCGHSLVFDYQSQRWYCQKEGKYI